MKTKTHQYEDWGTIKLKQHCSSLRGDFLVGVWTMLHTKALTGKQEKIIVAKFAKDLHVLFKEIKLVQLHLDKRVKKK